MPRQPTPEQRAEYERERDFLLALCSFWDEVVRQSPPGKVGRPGPDGEVVWEEAPRLDLSWRATTEKTVEQIERESPSKARSAVRMGLQDLLEITRDLTREAVAVADQYLASLGLETLTAVRARVWQTLEKVMKRGRIRTELEYYFIVERLNDVSDEGVSDADRQILNEMVVDYEDRRIRRRR